MSRTNSACTKGINDLLCEMLLTNHQVGEPRVTPGVYKRSAVNTAGEQSGRRRNCNWRSRVPLVHATCVHVNVHFTQNHGHGLCASRTKSGNIAAQGIGEACARRFAREGAFVVLADIDAKVDQEKLEVELMREGVEKFADPFKALLKLLAEKQAAMKAS